MREYGAYFGVTPESALATLNWQDSVQEKASTLYERLADRVAEIRFDDGAPGITITVTGTDLSAVEQEVRAVMGGDADRVKVVGGAAMTLADRRAFQEANPGREIDPITGATTADPAALGRVVEVNSCQNLYGGTTDGGRFIIGKSSLPTTLLSNPQNGWTDCVAPTNVSGCTQGFTATHNSAGSPHYEGYVTAGHCLGDESPTQYITSMYASNMALSYAGHRVYSDVNSVNDDAQFNREIWGSTSPENRVYRDEEDGFVAITSRFASGNVLSNTYLCAKGAANAAIGFGQWAVNDDSAGYFCGNVTDVSSNPHGQVFLNHWFELTITTGYVNAERVCIGGDSGGPIWASSKAYAIITDCMDTVTAHNGDVGYKRVFGYYIYHAEAELNVSVLTS